MQIKQRPMPLTTCIESLVLQNPLNQKLDLLKGSIVIVCGPNNVGKTSFIRGVGTAGPVLDRARSKFKVSTNADWGWGWDSNLAHMAVQADRKNPSRQHPNFALQEKGHAMQNFAPEVLAQSYRYLEAKDYIGACSIAQSLNEHRGSNPVYEEGVTFQSVNSLVHECVKHANMINSPIAQVSQCMQEVMGGSLFISRAVVGQLHLYFISPPVAFQVVTTQDALDDLVQNGAVKLTDQGSGVQHFFGVVASIVAFNQSHLCGVLCLDEPSVFLHPPQSRMLGKWLVKAGHLHKQVLCTTHDQTFLKGVLDASRESERPVHIVRLQRDEGGSSMKYVQWNSDADKDLLSSQLLRFGGPFFSALSHKGVVFVEAPGDALLYQHYASTIDDWEKRDLLFFPTHSKDQIKNCVPIMVKFGVKAHVAVDFDAVLKRQDEAACVLHIFEVLYPNEKTELLQKLLQPFNEACQDVTVVDFGSIQKEVITKAATITDETTWRGFVKHIETAVDPKLKKPRSLMKKQGISYLDRFSELPVAWEKLHQYLKQHRIHVLVCGELESISNHVDPPIPKKKSRFFGEVVKSINDCETTLRLAEQAVKDAKNAADQQIAQRQLQDAQTRDAQLKHMGTIVKDFLDGIGK